MTMTTMTTNLSDTAASADDYSTHRHYYVSKDNAATTNETTPNENMSSIRRAFMLCYPACQKRSHPSANHLVKAALSP